MTVRMAIPNKGRLSERAIELLTKSGIDLGEDWGRKLYVKAKDQDIEVLFVRAQDIPAFIDSGAIDIGITGEDMVAESGYTLKKLKDLEFGICRLSIAAPESSGIDRFDDIPDGARIATSFPNVTNKFFRSKKKKVSIIEISGAAEIMPYLGISDMISDLIATGSTLKTNRLKEGMQDNGFTGGDIHFRGNIFCKEVRNCRCCRFDKKRYVCREQKIPHGGRTDKDFEPGRKHTSGYRWAHRPQYRRERRHGSSTRGREIRGRVQSCQ